MTHLLENNGRTIAFSGDVMLDAAKMHTWFDTEWDYGFAAGIKALRPSVERLRAEQPTLMLPSQGKPIRNPQKQLREYATKLERLQKLYVRGYDAEHGSVAYQDRVSKPTVVSNVWQVSPHLFKFKRPNFYPNFSRILSDNGRALLSDCGLLNETMLDEALEGMRQHFGSKAIDAIIVSHMHGDHFLEAPHIRKKWGAQIWALDNMVDKMEQPERFDYAAPIQAYGKKNPDGSRMTGVRVDHWFDPFWVRAEPYRVTVKRGESVEIQLHVRNFNSRPQAHHIEVHTPPGLTTEVPKLEGQIAKASHAALRVRLRAAGDASTGVHVVAFDVTLDGRRYGERFDCIVQIGQIGD